MMQRRPVTRLLLSIALATSATGCGLFGPDDGAAFVTEDIARFWEAYDAAFAPQTLPAARAGIFRRRYLDPGSRGLDAFVEKRIESAERLTEAVTAARTYYEAIRANTFAIAQLELMGRVRDVYAALDRELADARHPDAYFLVGRLSTGGTIADAGILIGVELYARGTDTPVADLGPWQRAVTRGPDLLPAIVAHELVHVQQRNRPRDGAPLLDFAISEGMADFVGELLSGLNINQHVHEFADSMEAELWAEFQTAMAGTDLSRWMFNGNGAPEGRPADLGYYFGYKICEAFYEGAADRRRALVDMLAVADYAAFLEQSGYDGGT